MSKEKTIDALYAAHLLTELEDLRERSGRLQLRFAEIGFSVTGGHISMTDRHLDAAIKAARLGLKHLRRTVRK